MPTKKEWTLMFYLASDNPLAPGVISQLKSIKAAGFHKEANVIVQFDPHTPTTPTHVFDVNVIKKTTTEDKHNIGFVANDPYVHNLLEDKLWRDERDRNGVLIRDRLIEKYPKYAPGIPPDGARVEDGVQSEPGPQKSLDSFLTFCADSYPANHYILFLLGHGVVVGNDVFMYDEHGDEQTLTLGGLSKVLDDFNKKIKKQGTLELLSFHSCSVSSLEVAYELKDRARYMLASQGSSLVGNWPYRQILIRIFNELANGPKAEQPIRHIFEDIFTYCVKNSTDFLLAGYPFDLCLCDLQRINETKPALEQLSRALIKGLGCESFEEAILLAHLESQSFHYEMYTDVLDFCRCLYMHTSQPVVPDRELIRTGIQSAARNMIGAIRKSIVRSAFAGPEHQYANGLSLYFPWSRPVDNVLEKYAVYQLVEPAPDRVTWLHFLKEYLRETRRPSISDQKEHPVDDLGEAAELASANTAEMELLEDQIAVVYGLATVKYTGHSLEGEKPVKTDATDPLGMVCVPPSIKNYPRDTRRLSDRKQARRERFPLDVDSPPPRTTNVLT
jgi:hypothetical protein